MNNGGNSIITSRDHKTGTDRIFEAYKKLNLNNIDYIINLQGEEPMIDVEDIKVSIAIVKELLRGVVSICEKI